MALIQIDYKSAREEMKPGDVIAFSGKGHLSEIIKWATRSPISHVGVIMQAELSFNKKGLDNLIIESTTLGNFSGVKISRMSERLRTYDGEVWWLPLNNEIRNNSFDEKKYFNFLIDNEGKPYDSIQAALAGLDKLDTLGISKAHEDFSRFFCSELVAESLEQAGTVSNVNASEVTPIDLCMFNIYEKNYYQLHFDVNNIKEIKEIKGFNSFDPTGFGN